MPRRVLEGNIVSDKMDKTVTVLVERVFRHPVYKKYVRSTDKYAAHDEHNAFKTGDRVQIEECRPLSKRKSWRVITPVDPAMIKERPVKAAPASKPAAKKEKATKSAAEKKSEAKKTASKKKDDKK